MIKRQEKAGFRGKPGIMGCQNRPDGRFPAPKPGKRTANEGFHARTAEMVERTGTAAALPCTGCAGRGRLGDGVPSRHGWRPAQADSHGKMDRKRAVA